ncbi:adenosylmethionine--8-amino-7-oxononanoate transaminase [Acidiferrimicrobium sp. IK]|uniref:adenosylmethionine--8-amino-7-oxononanoate transaminase n=1 Tax=Acidiferrimicrobium sp. IK TaxID=2871700 RepID=UPI0021CB20CD|nr:adenosylmethionine--8-amino-7-oxononanoate transaminase [Acidiferrimicrobium sp. IK]MCU4186703.1 adenosylmethionine--8-amino-7-oxononanoate transaminase [Acidiferrimicrobium sp. IK]
MDVSDPTARDLIARDRETVWHPYAPMPAALAPLEVIGAQGTRLRLADGRELVDGMSSWWAAIHGYRHPVLDDALRAQLDAMAHVMFGGLTHRPAVELAELLVDITPGGLDHVFFCDSGSVSVEVAMKMALQYWLGRGRPAKHRLVTVRSGYHGDTLGAMAVCDPETGMHHMFSASLQQQLFAPAPTPRFGETCTAEDLEPLAALLADHREEVAAVILEPVVQGAGGMRFYAPGYLAGVRALCDEHGVLLIADEIATGFGRSGELFGCDHAGVAPDIMCVGKAMTGGYMSMAATLCTPEVAHWVSHAESGALMHGPTFMGNPLGCAVALASIRLLLDGPWQSRVRGIEAGLREGLAAAAGLPNVADVRVLGAIGVIELEQALPMAAMQETFVARGVWLRPFGRLVYAMPPYVASDDDVARIAGAMVAVARDVGPA